MPMPYAPRARGRVAVACECKLGDARPGLDAAHGGVVRLELRTSYKPAPAEALTQPQSLVRERARGRIARRKAAAGEP